MLHSGWLWPYPQTFFLPWKKNSFQEQEIQRRERELDSTVRRPAEAEKYRLEKIAEANRNRQIMEAEADAEAEILRGEAKAFAIEARAKAEAEQVSFLATRPLPTHAIGFE